MDGLLKDLLEKIKQSYKQVGILISYLKSLSDKIYFLGKDIIHREALHFKITILVLFRQKQWRLEWLTMDMIFLNP